MMVVRILLMLKIRLLIKMVPVMMMMIVEQSKESADKRGGQPARQVGATGLCVDQWVAPLVRTVDCAM